MEADGERVVDDQSGRLRPQSAIPEARTQADTEVAQPVIRIEIIQHDLPRIFPRRLVNHGEVEPVVLFAAAPVPPLRGLERQLEVVGGREPVALVV